MFWKKSPKLKKSPKTSGFREWWKTQIKVDRKNEIKSKRQRIGESINIAIHRLQATGFSAKGRAVQPAQGNALGSEIGTHRIGPTGQQFSWNCWPVGPEIRILYNSIRRALPWAGRTAAPLGQNRQLFIL
jgi:hypothetical protein